MAKSDTWFKKGEATGRPKGVQNKATVEIKSAIRKVFEDNIGGLQEELQKMSPATKWKVIESLLKFAYPTFSQQKLEGDINQNIEIKVSFSPINAPENLGSTPIGSNPKSIEDNTSLDFTEVIIPEVTGLVTKSAEKEGEELSGSNDLYIKGILAVGSASTRILKNVKGGTLTNI